mgnify:CR=1 FL=1|jgi:hypothetical protein
MDIEKLEVGKKYTKTHSMGQPNNTVLILSVTDEFHPKWGKYKEAFVEYVSEGCSNGLRIGMNKIECERYLREI